MSGMYKLNIGKTYATVKKIYHQGELFTFEEVKDQLSQVDGAGNSYFVEAGTNSDPIPAVAKKTVVIGKKAAPGTKEPAGEAAFESVAL